MTILTQSIRLVASNVYLIDDLLYSIAGLGSVYLLVEKKIALVDTGPATSAPCVLEAIEKIGISPEEVDYIIVTHIHLDHGGGVGVLLKNMPRAKVVVHHRAVRHIVDPSKLISSAVEAQGQEVMVRNGDMLPVPEDRAIPAHDLDTIWLDDKQVLTLLECPGHAPHQICISESRNGGIFVGDAVGHCVEGTDVMVPITPPPSFDLELYVNTLNRIKKLNASRIYFSHFGPSDLVQEKLDAAVHKLQKRNAVIDKAFSENKLDLAAERIVSQVCAELTFVKREMRSVYDYWAAVDIPMSAAEHVKYFRKANSVD
jgi:glyoxylase-like metal-dependent hydrolase (beta-lactamase superfamily II)